MAVEFKLPPLEDAIRRLDALMCDALGIEHPAMNDWVAVRFALQEGAPRVFDCRQGATRERPTPPPVQELVRQWRAGFYRDERWASPRPWYRWASVFRGRDGC